MRQKDLNIIFNN